MDLQAPQFHVIAEQIVSQCPSAFQEAELVANLSEDYSDIVLTRTDLSGQRRGVPLKAAQSIPIDSALAKIRKSWPGGSFNWCVFRVYSDGRFTFDVGYDERLA